MQLRDYQLNFVRDIRTAFAQGSVAPLAVAPTGAGKTACMSYIANGAAAKGNTCGIIVHRQELVVQTSVALARVGLWHGIEAPEPVRRAAIRAQIEEGGRSFYNSDAPSKVCSIQTIGRRLDTIDPFNLLFLDEGHHAAAGTWGRLVEAMPKAKILGLTATPERLDGKGLGRDFGGIYTSLVMGPTIGSLIEAGYLATPRVFSPPSSIDTSALHIKGGDFNAQESAEMMDRRQITGDAIDHYRRICNGVPAIAFCASVAHAKHVAEEFIAAGYKAACIDGNTPDAERRGAIRALGEGRLHVLTSCDIISEGTDIPIVGAMIALRPTQSLGLWRQQMGRVLRAYPGKQFAYILDHVGNALRLGLPEDEPEWSLEGRKKKSRDASEREISVSVTVCAECFASFSSEIDVCPHCGTPVERKTRQIDQVDGDLVEIDQAALVRRQKIEQGMAEKFSDLVALGKRRGMNHPEGWARNILAARKRKEEKSPMLALPEAS